MPELTRRSDLLKARLDRFSRCLGAVEKGDIRALHRARVASRRLRELLPILQLHPDTARKLNRRLRRVTMRLGTVRELDVLLLLVDELHVARRGRTGPIGRIGVAISKARDDARKHLFDRLPIGGLRRIARKLDKLVIELARREDDEPRRRVGRAKEAWRWAIDARVAQRAWRLRDAVDRAGAVYLPERLHEVRIGIKKLRYAVELSGEAAALDREPELRILKRGQQLLGRMHELQLLIDRVRGVQASLTPPSHGVSRELDTMVEALDEDCRRLHARYMRGRGGLLAVATTLTRGQTPARLRRGLTPTVVPLTTVASARRVS